MNEYLPEGARLRTRKNYEYTRSREGLAAALADGAIVEGIATLCDHKMTLHVDFGRGLTGIIERDEALLPEEGADIKDIAILTRVGKPLAFKVLGFRETAEGEAAVLSRRAAQRECRDYYISTLRAGDIIPARITHLENFGAFVDIGCGITSLLSIDTISVSRIAHPSARVSEGDTVYTVVRSIDERGRIYVSERELLGSWEENAALFSEGETVRGIIRSIESYGVFVELTPNLAGLAEYRDDVEVGQTAAVYIKSIIPEKMKIKLIIIDTGDAPTEPTPLEYFIDTESVTHINSWQYSPRSSKKIVETVFE